MRVGGSPMAHRIPMAIAMPRAPPRAPVPPWLRRPSPTLRPAVRLLRPLAIATKTAAAAVQSPLQQRRHPRAQPFEATSGPKAEHLAAAPDAEDLAFKHEFVEGEASAEERPASAASSTPSAPAEWEADVR